MRPRPSLVACGVLLLALLHALWGVRLLVNGRTFLAGTQLVSAGGLLLAAVSVPSPRTFSTGFAIAALATGVRLLANLSSPGPFLAPTAALVAGMGAVGWGAARREAAESPAWVPLALRGGFYGLAAAYAGFAALGATGGSPAFDLAELLVRASAAFACGLFVDAPPLRTRERKAFPEAPPMRTP
ncbi:MAG TPA: hypothetical protein VM370_01950 [Candidatus Thermoplasmatota archaeon]|nr:hypothetical protein [Candidatus Thermoplasmatota archaeon]